MGVPPSRIRVEEINFRQCAKAAPPQPMLMRRRWLRTRCRRRLRGRALDRATERHGRGATLAVGTAPWAKSVPIPSAFLLRGPDVELPASASRSGRLAVYRRGRSAAMSVAGVFFGFRLVAAALADGDLHHSVLSRPAARGPGAAECRAVARRWPHRPRAEKPSIRYTQRDALLISVFMNVFNVHSNRSPVDGNDRARGLSSAAPSSMPISTKPRPRTNATRWCIKLSGRRAHLRRAGRWPDRAAHPLLREARRGAGARPALRLHPLRLEGRCVPAAVAQRRRSRSATRLRHHHGDRGALMRFRRRNSRPFGLQASPILDEAPTHRAPASRHLFATESFYAGQSVCRIFRDRAGDEPAIRAGGDRHFRGTGARWHGRACRAPDQYSERVRRTVRFAGGHDVFRRCAGLGDVRVGVT